MNGPDDFEAFVRRYQDMVFATALRLLASPTEAEDIAQQVFLKAYQRFDQVRTSETSAGWLKTVTRNACLNHLSRYRRRWRFFSELDATEQSEGGYAETLVARGPAQSAAFAGEQDPLEAALCRLPDHQRVPLVLFHFEEASYQEIADALEVSVSKIKTDIHRGREALRRSLVQTHGSRRS